MKKLLLLFLLPTIAFAQLHAPVNGNVTLPTNGATDRFQMPVLPSAACSFLAASGNTGNIFYGGSTVTNASGSNVGLAIPPGTGIFNVSLTDLSAVFFSTATNGNKVQWTCN